MEESHQRVVDELVAIKIYGWRYDEQSKRWLPPNISAPFEPPAYSASASLAFKVAKEILHKKFNLTSYERGTAPATPAKDIFGYLKLCVQAKRDEDGNLVAWMASFVDPNGVTYSSSASENLAYALCVASLRALGFERLE